MLVKFATWIIWMDNNQDWLGWSRGYVIIVISPALPICRFLVTEYRWPVDSPDKGPVTRIMSPFDDVIMLRAILDKWFKRWQVINTLGEGTKAISLSLSIIDTLDLAYVPFISFRSRSYFTGVTTAQLRRHRWNIDVRFIGAAVFWLSVKKRTEGIDLVTPTPVANTLVLMILESIKMI